MRFLAATSLALLLVVAHDSAAATGAVAKLHPLLAGVGEGEQVSFFLYLNERADLSAARELTTKEAKCQLVFDRLTEVAHAAQGDLRRELDQRGVGHRPYWIVNAILVHGDREMMLELAARDEVVRVLPNPAIVNDLPGPSGATGSPKAPDATE